MEIFVDTGVLVRLVIPSSPGYDDARRAVKTLRGRGDNLVALTQNAAEFWNVSFVRGLQAPEAGSA